jgi:G3E family GTPase
LLFETICTSNNNNDCTITKVRGDLIRILGTLAKKRNKFDFVLIETTGLADPAPVAQSFFVDDEVRNAYYLDAILTMVVLLLYVLHFNLLRLIVNTC